jgi:hypothetical protein
MLSTHCVHRISTCFSQSGSVTKRPNLGSCSELQARNETQPSARKFSHLVDTSQGGSWQLEKRSLGGSCEKTLKPFEEPCPRMRTPWPGQFQVFTCVYFDAGSATRVAQYYVRLATHCSRLIVYTRGRVWTQAEVYEVGAGAREAPDPYPCGPIAYVTSISPSATTWRNTFFREQFAHVIRSVLGPVHAITTSYRPFATKRSPSSPPNRSEVLCTFTIELKSVVAPQFRS